MKPIKAKDLLELDKRMQVVKLQCYPIPEQVIYQAAKNDYSEIAIHEQEIPSPQECGEWIVDTLLANDRGHYGCYSSDTQVLTENGWVYWTEVNQDTVLAAYNTETGVVNFETPSAVQRWDYDGKMYHLTTSPYEIDLLVSPDHRILYYEKGHFTNCKELTAEEFFNLDKKDLEVVLFNKNQHIPLDSLNETWVDYKGEIHCATVSTGAVIVRRNNTNELVCGNCLEHPQITLSVSGYVHNVIVQARTHRIASFDCLAAESLISIKRGSKIKTVTISKLYEMYERNETLPLVRNLNEDRGYFEYAKIGKVFKNTEKDLYLVTLEDGKQLKCSMDHRIFTENGWQRLKNLSVGDKVACNGVSLSIIGEAREKYTNPIWLASQLKTKTPKEIAGELGVSYEVIKKYAYHFGLTWEIKKDHNTGKKLDTSHFTEEQRTRRRENAIKNIAKAHQKREEEGHPNRKHPDDVEERVYNWQKYNKERILEHYGRVCANCGATSKLHCHHKTAVKEDITKAYDIDNYEILCSSCHCKEHKSIKTHFVPIASIEFLRTDITYDIEIDGKYHNFVCDGIVVHNCQSQRYTGKRVIKVAKRELDVEDVFYVRPAGFYTNRKGKKYEWTEEHRQRKIARILVECEEYADYYNQGMAEEHLRDYLPQAIRQNFVMTMNLRSILHFMDLRSKMDAQLEIQALCEQMVPHLSQWAPNVWKYYEEKRLHKAKLAP